MEPIKFKDFTLEDITEEYDQGYSFGSTFGGDTCDDLTTIQLTLSDEEYREMVIRIEPYRAGGYYGGYYETGRGLSLEILSNLINMIINAQTITKDEFVTMLIEKYSKPYMITIRENGKEYLPLDTLIIIRNESDLGIVVNKERGTVIYENEISLDDNDNIKYERDKELENELNLIKQTKNDFKTRNGRVLTKYLIDGYVQKYSRQNVIIVNPSYETKADSRKTKTLSKEKEYYLYKMK